MERGPGLLLGLGPFRDPSLPGMEEVGARRCHAAGQNLLHLLAVQAKLLLVDDRGLYYPVCMCMILR